jgi:hypothetical protein
VQETILKDFGQYSKQTDEVTDVNGAEDNGGEDILSQPAISKPTGHMDLTQLLALLLIPALLKAKVKLGECNASKGMNVINTENSEHSEQGQSFVTALEDSTPPSHEESIQQATNEVSNTPAQSTSEEIHHLAFPISNNPLYENTPNVPRPKRWTINQSEKGDAHSPDSDLLENVLEMMIHDATGKVTPQPLTKELLRQLLMFYGEVDMAEDDALLDEMILAASHGAPEDLEGNPILLDKFTFARALTHDVGLYNIENEDRTTTNFYDVFHTSTANLNEKGDPQPTIEPGDHSVQPVTSVFTFPSIDYTADTFRSKSFVILLWVTWIISYFAFMFPNDQDTENGILAFGLLDCEANGNSFWCR